MPAISTMVYPIPAYVRVEVNWADVGSATGAAVYRVDCLTGERVPLRPYVSFDGDFIDLSCGYALFWDTESQLDRCVHYCTQAIDAAGNVVTQPPATPVLYTFSTPVVNGWGPMDTGQTITLTGGTVPGDYDVAAGFGTQTHTAVLTEHLSTVDTNMVDQEIRADVLVPVATALGGGISTQVWGRETNTNNKYIAELALDTSGNVALGLFRVAAGVLTTLSGSTNIASGHTATDWWRIIFQIWGNRIRVKAHLRTAPEPAAWMIDITDPAPLISGDLVALRSNLAGTNTNPLPLAIGWDNWSVSAPCAELEPIEVCSDDLVVPSSGDFRLGDPVRPCSDVTLLFNAPIDPDCVPTQGIFFGNMDDEEFTANTGVFLPVNSRYPIVANRTRTAIASTLTVASKTFPDRDAMRTLNEPGSPLLLRGPAQYGINDRYMSVGDVTEARPVSDHKVTPRVIKLPHAEVLRPSGPSQGVCGAQVDDLCDIYLTWDAIVAAGLTYADLLRGKASNETPIPDTVERTWNEVNSDYASWTALNAGEVDWDETLAGD